MGTLTYGRKQHYEFDDRTLEHLRVVITARLRKKESFFLSWSAPRPEGNGGSVSLWVTPTVPIVFRFSSPHRVLLSRKWVEALMRASYADGGLVLFPDPGPRTPAGA